MMTEPAPTCCPLCGGSVSYDYTCHTYESGGRWMACLPCDSAIWYSCDEDDCKWDYTAGLNPRNPRSADNEARRPRWIDACGNPFDIPKGVRNAWDDDGGVA